MDLVKNMHNEKSIFSPIQMKRASHFIEQQIKQAIFDEHYQAGDKLPSERDLAEIFQTSRTSVREALRSLEKAGFVIVKAGALGGAFISTLDPSLVVDSLKNMLRAGRVTHEDILQARLIFEPPIASEAAKKATPKDIERLEDAHRIHEEWYQTGDPTIENNPLLHKEIASITGNEVLCIIMNVLMDIHAHRMKHLKLDEKGKKGVLRQHKMLITAIKKNDPERAFENMKNHVLQVYRMHSKLEE